MEIPLQIRHSDKILISLSATGKWLGRGYKQDNVEWDKEITGGSKRNMDRRPPGSTMVGTNHVEGGNMPFPLQSGLWK